MVAPTRVKGGSSRGMAVAPGPCRRSRRRGSPPSPCRASPRRAGTCGGSRRGRGPRPPGGGEDRGEVAGVLDGGARGDADGGAHLRGDDHGEGGLAEAGGAGEQHVVGGGAAGAGGAQHQVELLADLLLADELTQVLGRSAASTAWSSRSATDSTSRSEAAVSFVSSQFMCVCLSSPYGLGRGRGPAGGGLSGAVQRLQGRLEQLPHRYGALGGLRLGSPRPPPRRPRGSRTPGR